MADATDQGWRVVNEYESNPLASDSDDEKRIYKAEARASRKLKAERTKKARSYRAWRPYPKSAPVATAASSASGMNYTPEVAAPNARRLPGVCFTCGKQGHWKGAPECPAVNGNVKLSINAQNDIVREKSIKNDDQECINKSHSMYEQPCVVVLSPVGRLKQNISKWKEASENAYILDVVEKGYKLPLKSVPAKIILKYNKSARDNELFVTQEINSLLEKGVISACNYVPHVVNPLTVAFSKKGKPRLVLDCRHVNEHLHLFKVKFEDIQIAQMLFNKCSYLFTYDLASAYHHIEIFESHRTFLGFSHYVAGQNTYYVFNALPFGIRTAGHIFTKVTKVVVKYLRERGIKVIMFLDDGIGGHKEYETAVSASDFTKQSLIQFGFLLADDKCHWEPLKRVAWLGYYLDMERNMLYILKERILRLKTSVASTLYQIQRSNDRILPARFVASVVGQIISLQSVIGNIVRLKTRHLFKCINLRASWKAPIYISKAALEELQFWYDNVESLNEKGKSIKSEGMYMYNVFADASGAGYGGYVECLEGHLFKKPSVTECTVIFPKGVVSETTSHIVENGKMSEISPGRDRSDFHEVENTVMKVCDTKLNRGGSPCVFPIGNVTINMNSHVREPDVDSGKLRSLENHVFGSEVVGSWSKYEQNLSSTWREAEAISRVVKTNVEVLRNSNVKLYSDNKNVKSVLVSGSRIENIHSIAADLNKFCEKEKIVICLEWIPREENELSDHLSRCHDSDDWVISEKEFLQLDKSWGPHSVDRFASHLNNKCETFNSRWWVPGTSGIDAFAQMWNYDVNWLVPPPRLIAKCIDKMHDDKAVGTLIAPKWKSHV